MVDFFPPSRYTCCVPFRAVLNVPRRFSMLEFLAFVDYLEAKAAYDSSSANSLITVGCLKSRGLKYFPKTGQEFLVSIHTSSGPFACLVRLSSCLGPENVDIVLGRDWFNYCTAALPDAHLLLHDGYRLAFSASPFHAVSAPLVPGEYDLYFFFDFFC